MRFGKDNKEKVSVPMINHISEGTVIDGDIDCEQELLVNGTVRGSIRCAKKLVIAHHGQVFGNVSGADIIVSGSLEGDVCCAGLLVLESQSVVRGKISSTLLETHTGAKIRSQVCILGDRPNVEELSVSEHKQRTLL